MQQRLWRWVMRAGKRIITKAKERDFEIGTVCWHLHGKTEGELAGLVAAGRKWTSKQSGHENPTHSIAIISISSAYAALCALYDTDDAVRADRAQAGCISRTGGRS